MDWSDLSYSGLLLWRIKSLASGRCGGNFKVYFSNACHGLSFKSTSSEIALRWMPLNTIVDNSTWLSHWLTQTDRYWAYNLNCWCCPVLVQIMAWCRIGTKPLSKPMLGYCQFGLRNKLQWNFKKNTTFHSWCTWKCRLRNGGHFVHGKMS